MTGLQETLAESARSYAHRAVEAYAEGRTSEFVLFGAIAIEHAVKSKLAGENPVFLADPRQPSSMVALHRWARSVDDIPHNTRTVGAIGAMRILTTLDPGLSTELSLSEQLINIRNGEAHLALGDSEAHRSLFANYLRSITSLLRIEPEVFWKPHYELVATTLNEAAEEVERLVAEKLAKARIGFERIFGSLDPEQQDTLRAMAETRVAEQVDDSYAAPSECPACQWPVIVQGDSLEVEVVDYDGDVLYLSGYDLEFRAHSIRCSTCGLVLKNADELRQSGHRLSWTREDVDVESWLSDRYGPRGPQSEYLDPDEDGYWQ